MKKHTNIMVVDDELAILRLLSRTLKEEGYNVVTAPDGESALSQLAKYKPDLIILDIMMPGLNGFEVLDIIRKRSNIPVIMLTAIGEVTTIRDTLSLGADDYIKKPFGMLELMARVRAKLRRTELGVSSPS